MRSVGLMAILLLFVACKPVARGPVSELQAVSDGNLTLGMVPVENDEGAQAYRLLVCRKSASYPQWMLEDNNRCRSALLDQEDNEVVFIHSELERDFAAKYTDYASGYATPALIGIGATAAVFGGGALVVSKSGFVKGKVYEPIRKALGKVKEWGIFNNRVVKATTGAPARIAERIPNYVLVEEQRFLNISRINKSSKSQAKLVKWLRLNKLDMKPSIDEQIKTVDAIHAFRSLEIEEKLLRGLKKAQDKGEDAKQKYLDNLGKTLSKMKSDAGIEPGEQLNLLSIDASTTRKQLAQIREGKKIEVYEKIVKLGDDGKAESVLDKKAVTGRLNSLTGKGQEDANEVVHLIQDAGKEVNKLKTNRTYTQFGIERKTLRNITLGATAAGAAGIAVVTMTDLDKSVWGYGDRQLNAHYSQVFSQSMQSENRVKDLPRLLEEFAEFFGHRVNPAALALGN